MSYELQIKRANGRVKIYWDEILYISLMDENIQVHSYKHQKKFFIEVFAAGDEILLELDNEDKWKRVLELLDTV